MTIQELREKRSKAWDTARDFLDSKRNESGLLSEEDSKTYDAMDRGIRQGNPAAGTTGSD